MIECCTSFAFYILSYKPPQTNLYLYVYVGSSFSSLKPLKDCHPSEGRVQKLFILNPYCFTFLYYSWRNQKLCGKNTFLTYSNFSTVLFPRSLRRPRRDPFLTLTILNANHKYYLFFLRSY